MIRGAGDKAGGDKGGRDGDDDNKRISVALSIINAGLAVPLVGDVVGPPPDAVEVAA